MNRVAIRRDQTIARLKKKNRISDAEAERVSHGLMPAAGLPALTSSDLVTETVSESGKTKKSVYTRSALSTSVRVAAGRAVEIGRSAGNRGFYFYRGTKFPRGRLAEIDDLGPDTVLKDLNRLNDAIPERR